MLAEGTPCQTRTYIYGGCGSREGPFHTSVIRELPFFYPAILPLLLTAQSLNAHVQTQPLRMRPTVITYPDHSPGKCPIPTLAEHVITNHTKSDNSWNGNCRVFLVGESRAFLLSGSERTITFRFLVRAFSTQDAGGLVFTHYVISPLSNKL